MVKSSRQFNQQIDLLFSLSKDISDMRFSDKQLSGLPDPVRRFFKHVLQEGQPYISYTRLFHDGQFKTSLKSDWINIEGEEYFTSKEPGFIWKGRTKIFSAHDMFISGKGRLLIRLFSIFKMADRQGPNYDQGELLRWLGENVWFPTNLLPNDRLKWFAIDDGSARLTFNYKDLDLFYIVRFNQAGEIEEMETRRFMDKGNVETWIAKLSDYRLSSGVLIPTTVRAGWRLAEQDHDYALFKIKKIEYNIPEKF